MKRILSVLAIVTVLAMLSCMFALPASAAVNTDGFAKEVVRLVNVERAKAGLAPLNFGNKKLNDAAMKRAKETTDVFSHTRPSGGAFYTIFEEFSLSYNAAGENIAEGQTSPAQVVAAWMDSKGHRENIMGGVYTDGTPLNFNWIGVAVCEKDGRLYWVQLFARASYTDDDDNDPKGGISTPEPSVAPGITGLTAMSLTVGYAATSTGAYTITGTAPVTVTKTSGDAKITWNNATKRLDIAAGLATGTYSVTLTASNGTAPNAAITFTLTVMAAHTHTFGTAWQKDDTGHWHECACGERSGFATHTPGDWMVDIPATATQAGSRHKQCIVCGYTTVTETIPAAGTPKIPGTTWEANTINMFLYYVCFGWLWMRLF